MWVEAISNSCGKIFNFLYHSWNLRTKLVFVLQKDLATGEGGGVQMNIFCQCRNVVQKTRVAKPYPGHTTFQTGVAATTPATPLPAPLWVAIWWTGGRNLFQFTA